MVLGIGTALLGSAALGLASDVMGGSGPDYQQTPTQRQGYQTLDDIELFKDTGFTRETLPQAVIDYYERPFVARPTRRVQVSDVEGDFGSRAMQEIQTMLDERAQAGLGAPTVQQTDVPETNAIPQSAMYAQSFLGNMGGYQNPMYMTKQNLPYQQFASVADTDMLSQLGDLLQEYEARPGTGMNSGAIVGQDNQPIREISNFLNAWRWTPEGM